MHFRPATNSTTLRHIVMMLLALAVLAERAALCPLPVRLCLIDILRRAEFAATALLVDSADLITADMLRRAPLPDGGDANRRSLIRLAFSLRVMAAMIAASQKSAVPCVSPFLTCTRAVTSPLSWRCALSAHDGHDTS